MESIERAKRMVNKDVFPNISFEKENTTIIVGEQVGWVYFGYKIGNVYRKNWRASKG